MSNHGVQSTRQLALERVDIISTTETPETETPIIYRPRRLSSLPTLIRLISESVTPKMPILWRTRLSSRLPFRRRRCQNSKSNGHKEVFYRESSASSSKRQNPIREH
ncbi:unnamed protein product [Hymenolepis diminuta]|uniref:Uncharacterized protein n=1 Tax=Hymenolepis diminuta TaxID=6216 RepID=A0A0R3SJD1_HYMDI|nr:unnamed protein product [Hymenolepis diminuta]